MASARNARRALARGKTDEALLILWNEVEPARLAGDAATLHDIGRVAQAIRSAGDPGQQREAERLLETLARIGAEGEAPAPVAVTGGRAEPVPTTVEDVAATAEEAEQGNGRLGRMASLVWIVLFLLIVIVNALRGIGGE